VRELARFEDATSTPNAPLARLLPWAESMASARLEGRPARAEQVAMAERGRTLQREAKWVVAGMGATRAALQVAGALNADAISEVHAELVAGAKPFRFGRQPLPLAGSGPAALHEALTRIPPLPSDEVGAALDDLVAFGQRDDVHPLARVAIAHARLQTVQPFAAGNGMVARALVHGQMRAAGILRASLAPMSAALAADPRGYAVALLAYHEGDVLPIVERFAHAALEAVGRSRRLREDLATIHERWREASTGLRRHATAWQVLPLALGSPTLDAAGIAQQVGASRMAVYNALGVLEERGVLEPLTPGSRRNRAWRAPAVLVALDRFQLRDSTF